MSTAPLVHAGLVDTLRERPLVLVVDDDAALQLLARESLEQDDWDVEAAPDCTRALVAFQRVQPDVILLDVNLPDGDGFSVCSNVRQLCGGLTTPVLMMTAADDTSAIHRAYEVGATDFITKPINWVLLRYRLRYILRAGRAFQRLTVSEARLARAQQIASLGHWELDLDTQTMHWSEEARRIFGLEPWCAQSPADLFWQAVHDDDRERVRAALAGLATSRQATNLEFRIMVPGGGERTVTQRAEIIVDETGRPRHMVTTVQDVTERVRLEAQLRQAQKMEAVGQMAGGIAHDFNNLLTVINGRCGLLLAHLPASGRLRRDAELIRQTGERAASLISQLLMFSRKQVLKRKVLDLNEVVLDLNQLIERVLGENITKTFELDRTLGLVNADRGQIEQVLLNLVVNARDAMPRGGRLSISTVNAECDEASVRNLEGLRPGSYVIFAVGDTGVGMDAGVIEHIFEPFFTTKGIGKGTGLGLATVFGIVKQHGGSIAVESTPGRGSTFTVYLPRVEAAAAASERANLRPLAATQGETILLAEDDDEVRDLSGDVLRQVGYTVLAASHGSEALRIAESHAGPIDLLVTDLVMPDMSGIELARQLSNVRPGIPSLFVSGWYPDDVLGGTSSLLEQVPFLSKPFSPDVLLRTVRELLDSLAVSPR